MYKLTVVGGPNRGSSYTVDEGETSIGRQPDNVVVLSSGKVSKYHCKLVINGGEAEVLDQGSSNGTFVNGSLVKTKKIQSGDRISVGDFVLELTKPKKKKSSNQLPANLTGMGLDNVLEFPAAGKPNFTSMITAPQVPTDLKGKFLFNFEQTVMPFFYSLNFRNEWRILVLTIFALFTVGTVFLSIYPLLGTARDLVVRETGRRAQYMARQIAERNAPVLAAKAETRTELGALDRELGVKVAVLTDLDSRILAPGGKLNQYLTQGEEAKVAIRAKELFRSGREQGMIQEVDETTIVAVEPVKVLSTQAGRNVIVGMAIVSLDTSLSTLDWGAIGVVYSEAIILSAILGFFVLLVLYRMTLKPLQILNEDMDKALKGEMGQVTREFKVEELSSLFEIINSAIQRIPRNGADGFGSGGSGSSISIDEFVGPLQMVGDSSEHGMLVFDSQYRIAYMNSAMEGLTGVRTENSIGQTVADVARDQAFIALCTDLFERSPVGDSGINEEFDFSGVGHQVSMAAFGSPGTPAKCFVMIATRKDD